MNTKRVNERGVLMLVAMVVIIVVAVMTSAYLFTLVTEKRSADTVALYAAVSESC